MINARRGGSGVSVVFGVSSSLPVAVPLQTSLIDRFLTDIFRTERKVVVYISKAVLLLAIKDMPEELKDQDSDMAQDVMVSEEDTPCMVHLSRKTRISPG